MKRVLIVLLVCSLLSLGSFAAMVFADRRLDVALPYSVPLALAGMVAVGFASLALFESLRARRPIVVRAEPVIAAPATARVEMPRASARPRARTQGLVLLDYSTFPAREKAA